MQTSERVRDRVRTLYARGEVSEVAVDPIGVGGGVLDRLRQLLPELAAEPRSDPLRVVRVGIDDPRPRRRYPPAVTEFDASKTAPLRERFHNCRSQGYWHVRKLLEGGRLALPPVPELDEELLAMRVSYTPTGKTSLLSKDDVKARIGRSPDLADSLVISFASEMERSDGKRFAFG